MNIPFFKRIIISDIIALITGYDIYFISHVIIACKTEACTLF